MRRALRLLARVCVPFLSLFLSSLALLSLTRGALLSCARLRLHRQQRGSSGDGDDRGMRFGVRSLLAACV